jgi:GNAT superfamily N-acetyltransferase
MEAFCVSPLKGPQTESCRVCKSFQYWTDELNCIGMEMFEVSPQCHGQGLGKALLHAFVEEAKKRRVNVGLSGVEGEYTSFHRSRSACQLSSVICSNDRGGTVLQEVWFRAADASQDDCRRNGARRE